MLTFLFCVLLLIPPVCGVCQTCFGQGASDGCGGSTSTCPWNTGISDNAAVVAAIVAGTAATKVISIGKLLPQRFRKLFPRSVLDLISTIYHKPKNGVEFDPTGKPLKVLVREIKAGSISKSEVMLYINDCMDQLDDKDENYEINFKKLLLQHSTIKDLPDSLACDGLNMCKFGSCLIGICRK